jgi:hypothetical protein
MSMLRRWFTRTFLGYEKQETWVGWRDGVLTVISDRWLTPDEVREHLSHYIIIGQPEGGTSTSVPIG